MCSCSASASMSALVVWDFENIIPTESTFDELHGFIIKKLQDFADEQKTQFRSPKVILCGNVNCLSKPLRNIVTMKTPGVTLQDACDEPKCNAADRKIFQIIFEFSIDNVHLAPVGKALIAVVSGDRDFAKVLGSLTERKFHVFVFAWERNEDLYRATSKAATSDQHYYVLESSLNLSIKSAQCWRWQEEEHLRGVKNGNVSCMFDHPTMQCRCTLETSTTVCNYGAHNCKYGHPPCGNPCQCVGTMDRNKHHPPINPVALQPYPQGVRKTGQKQCAHWRNKEHDQAKCGFYHPWRECWKVQQCTKADACWFAHPFCQQNADGTPMICQCSNYQHPQLNHLWQPSNARDSSLNRPDGSKQVSNLTSMPTSSTNRDEQNTMRVLQENYGINEATAKILVIREGYNEQTVRRITRSYLDRMINKHGLQCGQAELLLTKLNVSSHRADKVNNPNVPAKDQHHSGGYLNRCEVPDYRKAIEQLQRNMKPSYNVLLLGETGTGKSTLINYFTNYFYDNTTLTAYSKLRIAIPNRYYPRATEQFRNSEHDVHDPGTSKTKACTSYDFSVIGSRSKFVIIDTPGMVDTLDTEKDDHNIIKITEVAAQTRELSAIIIVMNGTSSRMTTNLKTTIARLKGNVPTTVLKNIIVVFTNCARKFQVNFDLNNLDELKPPSENVFCMSNSALSSDPSTWETWEKDDLKQMQAEWKKSMSVLNDIVCRVLQLDPCNTNIFRVLRENLMELRQKLHKVLLDVNNRAFQASVNKGMYSGYTSDSDLEPVLEETTTQKHKSSITNYFGIILFSFFVMLLACLLQ